MSVCFGSMQAHITYLTAGVLLRGLPTLGRTGVFSSFIASKKFPNDYEYMWGAQCV